jgi:hypothetical protein
MFTCRQNENQLSLLWKLTITTPSSTFILPVIIPSRPLFEPDKQMFLKSLYSYILHLT